MKSKTVNEEVSSQLMDNNHTHGCRSLAVVVIRHQYQLEGARESAYLRKVNFYRRSLIHKITGHVWTVPGSMHV